MTQKQLRIRIFFLQMKTQIKKIFLVEKNFLLQYVKTLSKAYDHVSLQIKSGINVIRSNYT